MPRPPILPQICWEEVFQSGMDFESWLAAAEFPDHKGRMEEIFRNLALDSSREQFLAGLGRVVHVVAIAEDWCGDVVRFAPVLAKLASLSKGNVQVRFVRRDQYPEVFARFLTNGGEAIPRFVFLNHQFVECGNWGPMPWDCRRVIARGKAAGNVSAARERVSRMYEADPNFETAVRELLEFLDIASCTQP